MGGRARRSRTSSCSTRPSRSRCRSTRAGSRRGSCPARRDLVGAGAGCRGRRRPITSTSASRRPTRAPLRMHDPDRRRHPRPVVRRASRVVPHARRRAAAVADAGGRRARRPPSSRSRSSRSASSIERLDVPEARIHVIPPGIERLSSECRASLSIPAPVPAPGCCTSARSSIAGTSSDLIRAFAPLARARADASLDIVGDNRSYPRRICARRLRAEGLGRSGALARVRHRRPSFATVRQARAFAFLSEYEGLGLTPLEALAAGVPPVLLDTAWRARAAATPRSTSRWAMCQRSRARSSRCCSTRRRGRGFSPPRRPRSRSTAGRARREKRWRCSKPPMAG